MARPKVLGNYAKLSASYYRDDAILEAGERAELLYVRGLAYCSEAMSDGFISDRQLIAVVGIGMRDAVKRASLLVSVGVWTRVEGGYVVTSWLRWNKSAEEIGAALRRDRERKAHHEPEGTDADSEGIPDGIRADSEPLYKANQATTSSSAPTERAKPPASPRSKRSQQPSIDGVPEPDPVPNGGALVAEWIRSCNRRPPDNVVGQVAKHVGALLEEGFDVEDIREALKRWKAKNVHPSVLPSIVNEVVNPGEGNVRNLPPQTPKPGSGAWGRRVVLPGPDASGAA